MPGDDVIPQIWMIELTVPDPGPMDIRSITIADKMIVAHDAADNATLYISRHMTSFMLHAERAYVKTRYSRN